MWDKIGVPSDENLLRAGNSCLLSVSGRHFLVQITEASEETIETSFPVRNYLVEGMSVDLEFHEDAGYLQCSTRVVRGPEDCEPGLVLRRPERLHWNVHRDANRIATDLTVQIRDAAHPRRYDASVLNLSAGGALIQTRAPLSVCAALELTLSLPGEPRHVLAAQVIHTGEPDTRVCGSGEHLFGVRFIDVSEGARQSINTYIAQRLMQDKC
jgi:Tfp pilus assembly protein PilZ